MAANRLTSPSLRLASRAWVLIPPRSLSYVPLTPAQQNPFFSRPFSVSTKNSASPAPSPAGRTGTAVPPKNQVPPSAPESESSGNDSSRLAAFLGEADSNDAHEANRDAFGEPVPALDATNSAYLGEADGDDAFEAHKDAEGRKHDPVDATHSAYLGEADSDDGFEGRRAAHPEEGDHNIQDASSSGSHGESGEGDGILEQNQSRRS